ncbi:MAG: non-ribosomal peptide synthetase, partial [Ignavibacteriae bacterium]|nr:non-ribosomal peptide synthetase [Ignavibacteriota bacterium]
MENIQDIYPLSPMQEGMLFHTIYTPNSDVYKEQFTCKIIGHIDIDALRNSWQKIMERHDILRTAFIWEDVEEPLQVVHQELEIPFSFEDISNQFENENIATDYAAKLHKERFDLTSAPLMKLTLIKLSDETHFLIWDHHHILFDGWGLPILMQEFMYIYSCLATGSTIDLLPTYPYKNYIAWLKNQDEENTKEFWQKKLEG